MIPMFTKLLVISKQANSVLGCSSRLTMRRYAGCCFVLSMLMSLSVREKKATSEPANRKATTKRKNIITISTALAARVIANKVKGRLVIKTNAEW